MAFRILLPVASLSPACQTSCFAHPNQAAKYVSHRRGKLSPITSPYSRSFDYADFFSKADRPGSFEGLRASEQGRRYVANWANGHAKGRKLITVTLRSQLYQPSRNSNFDSWLQFLNGLDRQIYAPVIVPDTDAVLDLLLAPSDLIIFREAAWNIGLRMSLYELLMQTYSNNGPAAWHINSTVSPSLHQHRPTSSVHRELSYSARNSAKSISRFATPGQIWWWKQDSLQNLRDGF